MSNEMPRGIAIPKWVQTEREAAAGFRQELRHIINKYSRENGSNTPDFILADYLSRILEAFDMATKTREMWYGRPDCTNVKGGLADHITVTDGSYLVPATNPHAPQKIDDFLPPPPEDNGHSSDTAQAAEATDLLPPEARHLEGGVKPEDHGRSATDVRHEG